MERLQLTEVADNDPAGYARWFGVLWGACAIIVLSVAAWKTRALTQHVQPRAAPGFIGVLGAFDPHQLPTAAVRYQQGGSFTFLNVQYPAGTRFVLLPASDGMQCRQASSDQSQDFPASIVDGPNGSERVNITPAGPVNAMPWRSAPVYAAGYMNCHLQRPLATPESFAGSELQFDASYDPSNAPAMVGDAMSSQTISSAGQGLHAAKLLVSASVDGAQNMQVYGGFAQSVSATVLAPGDSATLKYDDVDLLNKRDSQFVLVGALIALGAAMALEALRPFVEWIAASLHARRRKTS